MDTKKVDLTDINGKIYNIWEDHVEATSTEENLIPMFYPKMGRGGLLSIGLNPSFNNKTLAHMYPNEDISGVRSKFIWKKDRGCIEHSQNEYTIGIGWENESGAKPNPIPFFSAFIKLSKNIGLGNEINHIDLFGIRKTESVELGKRVFNGGNEGMGLNAFGLAQIKIVPDFLEKLEPKIILVANAMASRLVKNYLNELLEPSDKLDTKVGYQYAIVNKRKIPIFFSGMLSGRGQIDKNSRERLFWHMKRAVQESS